MRFMKKSTCPWCAVACDAILESRFIWNNFGEQGWHALPARLEHTRLEQVRLCSRGSCVLVWIWDVFEFLNFLTLKPLSIFFNRDPFEEFRKHENLTSITWFHFILIIRPHLFGHSEFFINILFFAFIQKNCWFHAVNNLHNQHTLFCACRSIQQFRHVLIRQDFPPAQLASLVPTPLSLRVLQVVCDGVRRFGQRN